MMCRTVSTLFFQTESMSVDLTFELFSVSQLDVFRRSFIHFSWKLCFLFLFWQNKKTNSKILQGCAGVHTRCRIHQSLLEFGQLVTLETLYGSMEHTLQQGQNMQCPRSLFFYFFISLIRCRQDSKIRLNTKGKHRQYCLVQ